jgi:hypothetical protein
MWAAPRLTSGDISLDESEAESLEATEDINIPDRRFRAQAAIETMHRARHKYLRVFICYPLPMATIS